MCGGGANGTCKSCSNQTCANGGCTGSCSPGACDDGNECTSADSCNSSGVCTGTAKPNNSSCTSNLNGLCQGGACSCYQSVAPVACTSGSSCMNWGFESGTVEGWMADPSDPDAVENIGVSTSRYHTGARSLAVTVNIGAGATGNARSISIVAPLCTSTGTVNLSGYTFSAWAYFTVTSGSIPMVAANLLQGMLVCRDTSTQGTSGSVSVGPGEANQWLEMRGTVNQASAGNYLARLTIYFAMMDPASDGFRGTMYVDDVRLSPP